MSEVTMEAIKRIVLHQMVRESIGAWLKNNPSARKLVFQEIEANPDVGVKARLKEYGLRVHITRESP